MAHVKKWDFRSEWVEMIRNMKIDASKQMFEFVSKLRRIANLKNRLKL